MIRSERISKPKYRQIHPDWRTRWRPDLRHDVAMFLRCGFSLEELVIDDSVEVQRGKRKHLGGEITPRIFTEERK